MKPIDELTLQRLVDGELAISDIRQLIDDAESGHWQQIAEAMVEDRLWQRSMLTSVDAADPGEIEESVELKPSAAPHSRRRLPGVWVVAALLLMAASVGFGFGAWSAIPGSLLIQNSVAEANRPAATGPGVTASAPDAERVEDQRDPVTTPDYRPVDYEPDYHLEVPDGESLFNIADIGPVDSVPLYRIANQQQLQRYQEHQTPAVSPELIQQFVQAGYQVKQDIEFISGTSNDGQTLIVPVRTVRFTPRQ